MKPTVVIGFSPRGLIEVGLLGLGGFRGGEGVLVRVNGSFPYRERLPKVVSGSKYAVSFVQRD
jgi:hypothetical protein